MQTNPELAKIANRITASTCNAEQPIIMFAADLIMSAEEGRRYNVPVIRFYNDPYLMAHVTNGDKATEVCVGGYNYAYQVKLVMDALAEVGFFG